MIFFLGYPRIAFWENFWVIPVKIPGYVFRMYWNSLQGEGKVVIKSLKRDLLPALRLCGHAENSLNNSKQMSLPVLNGRIGGQYQCQDAQRFPSVDDYHAYTAIPPAVVILRIVTGFVTRVVIL